MSMNSAVSSGSLNTSTVLTSGTSYLKSVLVSAAGVVNIYDGTSASGKLIFAYDNGTGTLPVFVDFSHMVQSKNGLYVEILAATAIVYYG